MKRTQIDRLIWRAKAEMKREMEERGEWPVCQSCGLRTSFGGFSHFISAKECLNSSDIPDELAWSKDNMDYECHDGTTMNCHLVTEATKESSYPAKLRQKNMDKKMAIYAKYRRWMYDELNELCASK